MKLNKNFIKIISLALGLAIGMVLIAKVCFELSYDTYFSDSERVYVIRMNAIQQGGNVMDYNQVSGAIAPGFKQYVPGVESATRLTGYFENESYYTEDGNKITAKDFFIADTCLFQIFDRPILAGDPQKVLGEWGKLMVSRSFAEKLGGVDKAIGQIIYNEAQPGLKLTVEGVYEDFPENSSLKADILLSMETYSKSSTDNWVGNERYMGFVKLQEGIDPASLTDAIKLMQEKNQPLEELEKAGYKLWYTLARADEMHMNDSTTKGMVIMLSFIAFLLVAASVVNFIFMAIASVAQRAKEVGVRKCYGASSGNILLLFFKETAILLAISIVMALIIIGAFAGKIESLIGSSISSLLLPQTIGVLIAVCGVIFLIAAYIPARIFMSIPVSTAFRAYKDSKRRWKIALLTIQFSFTVFLVCIMTIFGKQYDNMLNGDMGYDSENLFFVNTWNLDESQMYKFKDMAEQLPEVEGVALTSMIPGSYASGNNVQLPGDDRALFNIADNYYATVGTAEVFGFKFIEGREAQTPREVAVSRKFVEKMQNFADWSDGAIGKGVRLTEHSPSETDIFTICGVYEDFKIGTVYTDARPGVRFAAIEGTDSYLNHIVIKVNEKTPEITAKLEGLLKEAITVRSMELKDYKQEVYFEFAPVRRIKDSILLGGLFSLIISIIGLIGYIKDETQRRNAEMAIRKINGALPSEIIGLFLKSVMVLMLVAAIVGSAASYYVGDLVLQQFQDKITITPLMLLSGNLTVMAIVLVVVVSNSLKISNSNPVESLKDN